MNEILQVNADKIANYTGFKPEEVAIIKTTVAKGTTDTELAYFLSVAKSVNLNPFNREIWCYKDHKGNVLVFAGRDGFLKRAQESHLWNGMTSLAVYENDVFAMEVTEKQINISHKPNFKDRGNILGAYAIAKPKGAEYATVEWADWKQYNKGQFTWKDKPDAMIKKVAETNVLKKAFGITVIQSEYEFEVKDNVVVPLRLDTKSDIDVETKKLVDAIDNLPPKKQMHYKALLGAKRDANELTLEFVEDTLKAISNE